MAENPSAVSMEVVGDDVKQSNAPQVADGNGNRQPASQTGFKPCMVWLNNLDESVTFKQLVEAIEQHQLENAGGRMVLVKPRREQPRVEGFVFFRNREIRNELIDDRSCCGISDEFCQSLPSCRGLSPDGNTTTALSVSLVCLQRTT